MIPIRLSLTNFLSYKQIQTLDFAGFDLAVLSGNNGVGKSSLLEAITWCLWEQARVGSADELINQGELSMWVDLVFEHENGIYRVLRKRDRKKSGGTTTLEFQISDGQFNKMTHWQSLTEGTIRQTQEKIINTLKLTYDLFVNSSYLRQGHADEFTVKPPGQRKEILAQILNLSQFDALEQKARDQKKQNQSKLEILQLQTEELTKEIGDRTQIAQDGQSAQNEKDKLQKIINNLEAELKKYQASQNKIELLIKEQDLQRHRYKQLASDTKRLQTDEYMLTKTIANLNELLRNTDPIKKNYLTYQQTQKTLEDQNHKLAQTMELREAISVLEHKKTTLDETINRLIQIHTCPTCLRPMTSIESQKVVDNIVAEFKKTDAPKLEKLKVQTAKIGYRKEIHQKLTEKLRQISNAIDNYQQLMVAESQKQDKSAQLQKIQDQINKNKVELQAIAENGQAINTHIQKLAPDAQKAVSLDVQIAERRQNLSIIDGKIGELRAKLDQIDATAQKINAWQKEIATLQHESKIWDELTLAFGKKGVQTMIIEQTLPAIEEKANELLKRVTDGQMSIKFVTQKAKKTAKTNNDIMETLDIEISDEVGSRAYEMFSGGEAFRINFAIRVALAKLLAIRAGARLEFLVVDEGFGSLDTAGRDDIIAAINSIREDFKKIVVVSHVPEMKEAFQTIVEVTKDSSGSHVEVLT